MDKKFVN